MILINTAPNNELSATYGALIKRVKQYLTSGRIKSRFSVFDGEEIKHGKGYEVNILLGATNKTDPNTKYDEHGEYKSNTVTLFSEQLIRGKYAITISAEKLAEITGDDTKQAEFAAELADTLYQGEIDDRNAAIYNAINILNTSPNSTASVTIGTDISQAAIDFLTTIKAKVDDFYEGVTGTSYGNTYVGDKRMSAEKVVIIMSNATGAWLDGNGYAKVFTDSYLQATGVTKITTNRMPDNVVIVTDSRNIQYHKKFESFVEIPQSDGSYNDFYNKDAYCDTMKNSDGVVAFPYVVIQGTEE